MGPCISFDLRTKTVLCVDKIYSLFLRYRQMFLLHSLKTTSESTHSPTDLLPGTRGPDRDITMDVLTFMLRYCYAVTLIRPS